MDCLLGKTYESRLFQNTQGLPKSKLAMNCKSNLYMLQCDQLIEKCLSTKYNAIVVITSGVLNHKSQATLPS